MASSKASSRPSLQCRAPCPAQSRERGADSAAGERPRTGSRKSYPATPTAPDRGREPDSKDEIAASRSSHRDALHLEARLDDVSEWERRSQARGSVPRRLALALDQCAVGEEVEREVLGARISPCHFQELARQRGGSLDLPHRDEHLADAAQSSPLARPVGKPRRISRLFSNASSAPVVVTGCVDEHPAERVESGRSSPWSPTVDQIPSASSSSARATSTSLATRPGRPPRSGHALACVLRASMRRGHQRAVAGPRRDASGRPRTTRERWPGEAAGRSRSRSQSSAARRSS